MYRSKMNKSSLRFASWTAVAVVASLLIGVSVFIGLHIDSAIETATRIARPHEAQTALEHTKATLDALQDSVQDYISDGAEGMRIQYVDAVRALRDRTGELAALGAGTLPASDVAEVDQRVADGLGTTGAVIEARNTAQPEATRQLGEMAMAAVSRAHRELDTLINDQQQLLRARERALRWDVAQIFVGVIATAAIVLCVLAAAVVLVDFDQRRQAAAQNLLRSENERLESAVRERSETLAQANRELSWFSKRALQIQEQERRSLALELHDQIGQELASLVLSLTRCERAMATTAQSDLRGAVRDSIEIARATYGDVHNLALGRGPARLDPLGWIPTLQWYARQQAKRSGCEIVVEADTMPVVLPSDILIAAFRIVQEAVGNAVRHAAPRRIDIEAHYHAGRIQLRVREDGAGFEPGAAADQQEPRVGLGLVG